MSAQTVVRIRGGRMQTGMGGASDEMQALFERYVREAAEAAWPEAEIRETWDRRSDADCEIRVYSETDGGFDPHEQMTQAAWERALQGGESRIADRASSVDDSEIDSLMAIAGQAGDRAQVAICLVALGRDGDEWERECIDEERAHLERLGIIPEHVDAAVRARAECAAVIADARGR